MDYNEKISQAGNIQLAEYSELSQAMEMLETLGGVLADARGRSAIDWKFQQKPARGLCTICKSPFTHQTHSVSVKHIDTNTPRCVCRECVKTYSPVEWWEDNPEVQAWINEGTKERHEVDEQTEFQRRNFRDALLNMVYSDPRYLDRITGRASEWVKQLGAELR